MPSRRIHRRALVGLGALLLVLSVWPFFCVAAIPVPSQSPAVAAASTPVAASSSTTSTATIINPSDLQTFLNLLNNTQITDINSSITDPVASPTRSASPQPNTALIIGDDKHRQLNATAVRPRRSLRDRIARKKSEKVATVAERSHDEITVKFKSPTSATELNLDESQAATVSTSPTTPTIEMPDMQHYTDALLNLSIDYRSNKLDDNLQDTVKIDASTEWVDLTTALAVVHRQSPGHGNACRNTTRNHRSISQNLHLTNRKRNSHLDRNERSANLSHIMGTARKIQLLMKNRLIQILPDGTVNGTEDDSDYSKCRPELSSILIHSQTARTQTDLGHKFFTTRSGSYRETYRQYAWV